MMLVEELSSSTINICYYRVWSTANLRRPKKHKIDENVVWARNLVFLAWAWSPSFSALETDKKQKFRAQTTFSSVLCFLVVFKTISELDIVQKVSKYRHWSHFIQYLTMQNKHGLIKNLPLIPTVFFQLTFSNKNGVDIVDMKFG